MRGQRGLALLLALLLAGCSHLPSTRRAEDQLPQLVGPRVTRNTTPLEPAFACMETALRQASAARMKIGVGQVRDYTGKFSELDGGSAITQGGSLMTISALGKLRGAVRLFERFDTQVAEWELGFLNKRYLGDENQHQVNNNGQMQQVPWKPYLGGTVVETDYFVVGGITELNYAVYSGGVRAEINQMGPSARTFVANVAVDLRLIDSKTLEVLQTVSLQKQVVGYEVKLSVFEFFDSTLVDFEAGTKHNEPLQLAVRTTLEQAVLELMGPLAGVDPQQCIHYSEKNLSLRLTPELRPTAIRRAEAAAPEPAASTPPPPRRATEWPSGSYRVQPAAGRPGPRSLDASDRSGSTPLAPPAAAGTVSHATPRRVLGEAPAGEVPMPPAAGESAVTAAPMPAPSPALLPLPPDTGRRVTGEGEPGPRGIGADSSRRPRELDASEP